MSWNQLGEWWRSERRDPTYAEEVVPMLLDVLKGGEAVARTRSIIVLSTVKEELFVPSDAISETTPES